MQDRIDLIKKPAVVRALREEMPDLGVEFVHRLLRPVVLPAPLLTELLQLTARNLRISLLIERQAMPQVVAAEACSHQALMSSELARRALRMEADPVPDEHVLVHASPERIRL